MSVLLRLFVAALFLHFSPLLCAEETQTRLSPEIILGRIDEAEKLCRADMAYETPLRATHGRLRVKGKLKKVHFVATRPVVLCAFRESDQSWHVVEIRVQSSAVEGERVYTYAPVQSGYTADRLMGRGTTLLTFDLADASGEHLVVYRARHLDIPQGAIDRELSEQRLLELAESRTYTPAHPDFLEKELVVIGMRYLKEEILAAQKELRDARVPSRTFPDSLLADVVPWEIIMALGAIEQMDDERSVADPSAETSSAYLHYALNKEKAFRYSVSSANAVGPLQFTNANGNGTYSLMVRECKGADLDQRFPEGAMDLRNVIKAAICLIDWELARLPLVHELYERKPLIGGIHPVACYNGGHGWCVEFGKTLKRLGVDLESEDVELPDTLIIKRRDSAPAKGKKKGAHIRVTKKIENRETAVYVQKYVSVINFLVDHAEMLKSGGRTDGSAQ